MIVDKIALINIQRQRQLSVSLQPSTFIVTWQLLIDIAFITIASSALAFLFLSLTFASDEDLALTRLVLLTWERSVARLTVWMSAELLGLATRLLTFGTASIFAFTRSMTGLAAEVRTTAQLLAAYLATSYVLKPALLVL